MKTIIAGSRTITDIALVDAAVIESGFHITEVVSGVARGIDKTGETWAEQRGIPIKRFHADWDGLGTKAGPIRNSQMATYGEALIAIWDGHSVGTKDIIMKMRKKEKPVFVYRVPNAPSRHKTFTKR